MGFNTTRRGFLASAGAVAFTIGFGPKGAMAATADAALDPTIGSAIDTAFTPFVRIGTDGQVTVLIKHVEMGQGASSGLASFVAEELNHDLGLVKIAFPDAKPEYANTLIGFKGTGGSTATPDSFLQYRKAGAAARDMFKAAAAEAWGVDPADVTLENGVLTSGDHSASFAELLQAAAAQPVPEDPKLKETDFRIFGKEGAFRRVDGAGKINGTAIFATDIQLDNQITAMVIRPPRLGAVLTSFDASGAEGIRGFINAAARADGRGVVVYGENTWAAMSARSAITAEWDFSNAGSRSTDEIRDELLGMVRADPQFNASHDGTDIAAVEADLANAAQVVEAEFFAPYLAHAPMEPMCAVIEPTAEGGVILHDGTQFAGLSHPTVAAVLGLDPAMVENRPLYAGGSFGRRANFESDYQAEAAEAFAMTDRTRPVKLAWSREDDIQGGYYRPAFAHRVRVGLDGDGKIVAWDHRLAGQSIMKGSMFDPNGMEIDHISVEGVADTPYSLGTMHVGLTDQRKDAVVLWWRSVGHSHTGFVMESMMDMAAEAAGIDPLEFRLNHLPEGEDGDRLRGVLELVTQNANWGNAPEGHGQGLAVVKSFGTYVAEVVEVSGTADDAIRIEKVTCAVDCGLPINPDMIRAQMEGGIGFALSAVMRGEITMVDGEVQQTNFYDFMPLRIGDIRAIETHIVPSTASPTGVGEPGVPPAGPALANAIARTGTRVTMLPLENNGVYFY
ncbi:xanthine dehydrogenase family protein molybdopterin-binding subunit [Ketogulonicigenium vulgare]|uniref:xanthine dehydrogenase family protein molybdopterin-binding subunit n=1 Tax=Ketogulonicigenium vulgare TaxID=92945 RepID=UPI0023594E5F|nr:molybdopterin cofactor-binding domain-containing protein [Ketogulonicigenium vulgare]